MILTSPLLLNGTPIEKVETLGLLISSDLSWTSHIDSVCLKAKRIWVYCTGATSYNLADNATIKQLYIALVRPHMEYACVVWDPYTQKSVKAPEHVQAFACKMMSH